MIRLWEIIKVIFCIIVFILVGAATLFGSIILIIPVCLMGIGVIVFALARDPPDPNK